MGTPTASTWVFEDAYYAICTAASAGFLTVGVADEDEPREDELRERCDIFFSDFSEYDRYF